MKGGKKHVGLLVGEGNSKNNWKRDAYSPSRGKMTGMSPSILKHPACFFFLGGEVGEDRNGVYN